MLCKRSIGARGEIRKGAWWPLGTSLGLISYFDLCGVELVKHQTVLRTIGVICMRKTKDTVALISCM